MNAVRTLWQAVAVSLLAVIANLLGGGPASAATLDPPTGLNLVVQQTGVAFGQGTVTGEWEAVTGALAYRLSAKYAGVVVASVPVIAPATKATVTGLEGGKPYDFVVETVNGYGFGPASSQVRAIPRTAPDSPVLVGTPAPVNGGTDTQVTWAVSSNGGAPITHYTITQAQGSKISASISESSAVGEGYECVFAALTCTFDGVDNPNISDYSLVATNAVGFSTTEPLRTVPGMPQSLSASATSTGISAAWLAPTDAGGSGVSIDGYIMTVTGAGVSKETKVDGSTLGASVTGLAAGSYTVTVSARNVEGIGPAAIASTTLATNGGGSGGSGSGGSGSGGGTGGTSGVTPPSGGETASPATKPSGVLPARVRAKRGARIKLTVRLAVGLRPASMSLIVKRGSAQPKVAKARFTAKGSTVVATFRAPRVPGTYVLSVRQGKVPIGSTRMKVVR